jgi:hypothetical protein
VVHPETQDDEPVSKLPPRRILPGLLGAQAAVERVHQEADERAAQGRRARPERSKASAQPQQPEAGAWPADEGDARREIIPQGEISPVPVCASEPVQADTHSPEASPVQPATMPSVGGAEPNMAIRKSTKHKRVFKVALRGVKRRGEAIPLRPGERWKRRLPEVCW